MASDRSRGALDLQSAVAQVEAESGKSLLDPECTPDAAGEVACVGGSIGQTFPLLGRPDDDCGAIAIDPPVRGIGLNVGGLIESKSTPLHRECPLGATTVHLFILPQFGGIHVDAPIETRGPSSRFLKTGLNRSVLTPESRRRNVARITPTLRRSLRGRQIRGATASGHGLITSSDLNQDHVLIRNLVQTFSHGRTREAFARDARHRHAPCPIPPAWIGRLALRLRH